MSRISLTGCAPLKTCSRKPCCDDVSRFCRGSPGGRAWLLVRLQCRVAHLVFPTGMRPEHASLAQLLPTLKPHSRLALSCVIRVHCGQRQPARLPRNARRRGPGTFSLSCSSHDGFVADDGSRRSARTGDRLSRTPADPRSRRRAARLRIAVSRQPGQPRARAGRCAGDRACRGAHGRGDRALGGARRLSRLREHEPRAALRRHRPHHAARALRARTAGNDHLRCRALPALRAVTRGGLRVRPRRRRAPRRCDPRNAALRGYGEGRFPRRGPGATARTGARPEAARQGAACREDRDPRAFRARARPWLRLLPGLFLRTAASARDASPECIAHSVAAPVVAARR